MPLFAVIKGKLQIFSKNTTSIHNTDPWSKKGNSHVGVLLGQPKPWVVTNS